MTLSSCYLERLFPHGQCVTMHWQLEARYLLISGWYSWCNVRLTTNIDFNSSQMMRLAACEFKYVCSNRIQISNNPYKIHCLLFLFPSQDLLTAARKIVDSCLICLVPIFIGHINGRVFRTGRWAKRLDVTEGEEDGLIFIINIMIIIIIIIIIIKSCWYLTKEISFKAFKISQILIW